MEGIGKDDAVLRFEMRSMLRTTYTAFMESWQRKHPS
jgi:hypothetical protein